MLRRTFCVVTAAALLGVAGCGGGPDGLVKDMISDLNAAADAMEKGDEAKVKAAMERLAATEKKLKDLKLSDDEMKKLMEKHNSEMLKAMQRLSVAFPKGMGEKLGNIPSLPGIPGGFPMPGLDGSKPADLPGK